MRVVLVTIAKCSQKHTFRIMTDVMNIFNQVSDDHPQARYHWSHTSQLSQLRDTTESCVPSAPACALLASVLSGDAAGQLAVHRIKLKTQTRHSSLLYGGQIPLCAQKRAFRPEVC